MRGVSNALSEERATLSTSRLPSLADIRNLLGKPSVASWRSWFQSASIAVRSTTRDALVRKVQELVGAGDLSVGTVERGRVEIEEAANKLVYLYRVEPKSKAVIGISDRLSKLGIALSASPVLAASSAKSKLVYAVNDTTHLRVKWTETHTKWKSQLPTSPTMKPEQLSVIVVLVLNKVTGLIQLRFDKPERDNPHKEGGYTSKEAYFNYYREQSENICNTSLDPVELRPAMEAIINRQPFIVELAHNEQLSEDGFVLKYSAKRRGKDVRHGKHYAAAEKHAGTITTHEVESMTWLPEPSGEKISRRVFTHVDGRQGTVRFDSYCHEAELSYVLEHFSPSSKS